MRIQTMIAAGIFILASTVAQAAGYTKVKDDQLVVKEFSLTVDQLEDLHVYDASGNLVGDVEDVLGTSATTPTALAVDSDKYLGQEGNDIVIGFGDLKLDGGRLVTPLSKDELSKLPRYND